MQGLKLVKPDGKYRKEYLSFVAECAEDIKACGMDHFMPLSSESSFLDDVNNLLNIEKGIGLPSGWVPASTYWLMDDCSSKIYGAINIRHRLTEYLRFRGGHVAYYVHRLERKKGYATKMLGLGLEKCRELGIDKVLITCAKKNAASARTIVNNGGVLDSEDTEGGEVFQRYWIDID